jgi:pimeloyl-ACP methyl ester carboxylesterase
MAAKQFPIVLAHGIARFDIFSVNLRKVLKLPDDKFSDKFEYFKGIKTLLEAPENGFKVFHPNQDFAGPVEVRAEQLKQRVIEIMASEGVNKVHIIAHSMGGLDSRHMIVDKGMAEHVATLTTIGTPHSGTSLASLVNTLGGFSTRLILSAFINVGGLDDLTIKACNKFNLHAEDQEARNGVFYQTYASSESRQSVFTPLKGAFDFIQDNEGDNDGLVPVASQKWKSELVASDGTRKAITQKDFPVRADHLNEVGWWDIEENIDPTLDILELIRRKEEFEKSIRGIYLEIAQHLPE